ncbi:MAG: aspartate 1-decarboxylase [Myxococcota bacterium]
MQRTMFKSKIHRATVTHADLHYEGSVTIDRDLLDAADMLEHEWVAVWNVTNGERIETYTLAGERGSGIICLNGAAAHRFTPGDLVIIATRTQLPDKEARTFEPTVVLVDSENRIRDSRYVETPGPAVIPRMTGASHL